MKVLVTGASGLLGVELCQQLSAAGHEVWAVDDQSRGKVMPQCNHWLRLDLSDRDSYTQLPRDFEYIYHYAAINGTSNFYQRPLAVLGNNFSTDLLMFKFAAENHSLVKLVYAGSSEVVVGDPVSPVPEVTDISIENIHNPRWSYRLAKICAENYLVNSELPWVIIRHFNAYGSNSKAGHFVSDQIEKMRAGVFEIIGPEETRSFCYVRDAMAATICCAERTCREVINVGTDQETLIMDAANIIAAELGFSDPAWVLVPGLPGSTPTRRPDITRLREIMPEFDPLSFAQGIQLTVAEY